MSFEAFTELYIKDVKNRLKENTWLTKEHIIRTKLLPYFGKLKISEISTKEIITWQNEMLAYRDEKKKPYSQTYLKTLHNQELLCKGWFLPSNTYDCGSFVGNGTAVVGKEPKKPYNRCKSTQKGADSYEISIRGNGWHLPSGG